MKIATWNVNGIRAREAQLVDWVAEEKPDILCLQEIKASPEQLSSSLFMLAEYWNYWHGAKGGYSGVSLHLRKDRWPETPAFSHPPFDAETRIVQARVGNTVYASVYIPNGGKDFPAKMVFLKELSAWIAWLRSKGDELVLCGDLNVAFEEIDVHPSLRNPDSIGQLEVERAVFREIQTRGMVDVGRTFAPENDRLYSWWPYWRQARAKNVGWRLDYFLASDAIAKTATSCVVRTAIGTSDHAPVVAVFGGEEAPKDGNVGL